MGQPSLEERLEGAIVHGLLGGLVVAAAGFLGHVLGNKFYPQPAEQVPSDLLLVPFGCLVGAVVGGVATLVRPGREAGYALLVVAALVYANVNYNYAKGRAIPPGILVDFEPDPATAERCGASCPPDTEWTVEGRVRVRAIRVEGDITKIRVWSSELPPSGRNTIAPNAGLARFRGPTVELTGNEIVGERHLRSNDRVAYPLRYSYQNRGAESGRQITVTVELTDANGRPYTTGRYWHVR